MRRQDDHEVRDAHQRRVDPAAGVAGHRAERRADEQRQQRGEERDAERQARAGEQPREHVASERVAAQQEPRLAEANPIVTRRARSSRVAALEADRRRAPDTRTAVPAPRASTRCGRIGGANG